jgi:hypothetical protein
MIKEAQNSLKDFLHQAGDLLRETKSKKKHSSNKWPMAKLIPTTSEEGNVIKYTCIRFNVSNKK